MLVQIFRLLCQNNLAGFGRCTPWLVGGNICYSAGGSTFSSPGWGVCASGDGGGARGKEIGRHLEEKERLEARR